MNINHVRTVAMKFHVNGFFSRCLSVRPAERFDLQVREKTNRRKMFVLFFSHPIFPLLNIVFNKCELATNSSNPSGSVDEDILAFTKQNRCSASNDSEIDQMVKELIEWK